MGLRKGLFGLAVLAAATAFGQTVLTSRRPGWWEAKVEVPSFRSKGAVPRLARKTALAEARKAFDAFKKQAREEIPPLKKMRSEAQYELQMDATVSLDTPKMVSAYWETYAFYAGAHGTTTYTPLNFGLLNGKARRLRLRDLFRPGTDVIGVATKGILKSLRKGQVPSGVESGEWKGLTPQQAERFAVSRRGVTWLFGSYELGSYAEGTFKVLVPFRDLPGILSAITHHQRK